MVEILRALYYFRVIRALPIAIIFVTTIIKRRDVSQMKLDRMILKSLKKMQNQKSIEAKEVG